MNFEDSWSNKFTKYIYNYGLGILNIFIGILYAIIGILFGLNKLIIYNKVHTNNLGWILLVLTIILSIMLLP